jgi:lipoate-protein ligase A
MAIDKATLWARSQELVENTIRFYMWEPSAVSIGFFQSVKQEVNVEACGELNVDIVRRITGGGAVYHDRVGELTYSVVVDQNHPKIPKSILDSYVTISKGLIFGLKHLGVEADFKPINDIVVGGRKISGNAQTRRWNTILQHGTILLKTDVSTIFKVLTVSKEKISDKAIKTAEERVTSISKECGREISPEEVKGVLKPGFEEALGIKLIYGKLTALEEEKAKGFRRKFSSKDWIFRR